MIPLILRLKKRMHKEIAKAQDLIIQEMLNVFDYCILHGGTAIWRCYNGNRFSEDIDVYLKKDVKKINLFFENLKKKEFIIKKKKIGQNSLYSNLQFGRVFVRFEALFKKTSASLREYENIDGNMITVYTLTSEELINEKVETYLKRFKIRDIYDIFFLLRYVKDRNKIKKNIKRFINVFKKPIDEPELKVLIMEGLVPDSKKMFEYIKQRV